MNLYPDVWAQLTRAEQKTLEPLQAAAALAATDGRATMLADQIDHELGPKAVLAGARQIVLTELKSIAWWLRNCAAR